jgi:peptide/nickel transport system permease protein
MGLDNSLWVQYWQYLVGLFHGNLGTSVALDQSVSSIIAQRLPPTLQIVGAAFIVTMMSSLAIGLGSVAWAQRRRGRASGRVLNTVLGGVVATPEFVSGTYLSLVFSVGWKLLPAGGESGSVSMILPVVVLSLAPTAALSRIVRAEGLAAVDREYMRAARAKRLSANRIYLRHLLPNILTATMTIGGLIFTAILGGTVIVESIFNWPGLGSTLVTAALDRDYPVLQGIVLVFGCGVIVVNFSVDVLLRLMDPRSLVGET